MITETDKKTIREISEKYQVRRVLLFGSSLDPSGQRHDSQTAGDGMRPEDCFTSYGDLLLKLPNPVDVIDLSGTSKFVRLIEQEGIVLYG